MTTRDRARNRLMALPTAGLGTWPTPLHRLNRFGDAIGAEVGIDAGRLYDDVASQHHALAVESVELLG